MSKSIRHKEKYANKREITQSLSADGTTARTRPFSIDEILQRRKNKKQSGRVEDQHASKEYSKLSSQTKEDKTKTRHGGSDGRGTVGISGCVESDRHKRRHSDIVGGSEDFASKESLKASSRMKKERSKIREGKVMKGEDKESNNAHRRSKASAHNAKDGKKERGVHDKRKNEERLSDDADDEYGKRHAKKSAVKDRDRNSDRNGGKSEHVSKRRNQNEDDENRGKSEHVSRRRNQNEDDENRGKSEHVSKRRNQNEDDERNRDRDAGKKHESRKVRDSDTSERTEKKETTESRHEDSKLRSKRSRSREHGRDKTTRSVSPSPRGHKQSSHDVREHEGLSSLSTKDRLGRFDSDIDRKRISSNGSGNKSRRPETSSSRLGGYSPRKRKTEAAVKTPSPTNRSPEKKHAGWDSPPARVESKFPSSFRPDLQSSNKTELSSKHEFPSVVPFPTSIFKPTIGVLSSTPNINVFVESIQLTQATRPKRRLYVENLPSSATEAAVMEWLNGYLRPFGVNYMQGRSPCISCIVHKEKGQALVEFLTPEDASMALSFDGKSFSGNILKIRRPKDYVEVTTGVSEKPVAAAVPVKDIVEDSPNKIFIGGIAKAITSEMLMEIAGAFGPLKAYHFEVNKDIGGPCAFVEYVDQSVTLKACAGLNGMKLGGQVLTVTQAIPDSLSVENLGDRPFYEIPVHARPLLEKPTQVLKLNNVLDPLSLLSLSEPELEEILEDVRLECARFGVVKSVNIIKHTDKPTSSETGNITKDFGSPLDEVSNTIKPSTSDPSGSDKEHHDEDDEDDNQRHDDKQDGPALTDNTSEPEKVNGAAEANGVKEDKHENKMIKDEAYDTTVVDEVQNQNSDDNSNQISSGVDQSERNDSELTDNVQTGDVNVDVEMENDIFEPGCVLVEYRRAEASSMAAHCLHGRVFDGKLVNVGYVSHDIYLARFHK